MADGLASFQWDEGNWPKCAKHGLSREEIEFVLSNRLLVRRDPSSREQRFNAVGRTGEGRYAFIVFTLRPSEEDMLIRPISARYMHRKEIENYEGQKGTQTLPFFRKR